MKSYKILQNKISMRMKVKLEGILNKIDEKLNKKAEKFNKLWSINFYIGQWVHEIRNKTSYRYFLLPHYSLLRFDDVLKWMKELEFPDNVNDANELRQKLDSYRSLKATKIDILNTLRKESTTRLDTEEIKKCKTRCMKCLNEEKCKTTKDITKIMNEETTSFNQENYNKMKEL